VVRHRRIPVVDAGIGRRFEPSTRHSRCTALISECASRGVLPLVPLLALHQSADGHRLFGYRLPQFLVDIHSVRWSADLGQGELAVRAV
jgi:hypothetical protein